MIWLSLWGGVTFPQDSATPLTPSAEKVAPMVIPSTETGFFPCVAVATAVATMLAGVTPTVAAVVIGGGLGALSRYGVSQGTLHWVKGSFHGTMLVNILGSFAFGTVTGRVARGGTGIADTAWLDLMTTGFLGGFTTFSTFANDTVQMAHREGLFFSALYTGFSVAVAVMAILAGEFAGTTLLP